MDSNNLKYQLLSMLSSLCNLSSSTLKVKDLQARRGLEFPIFCVFVRPIMIRGYRVGFMVLTVIVLYGVVRWLVVVG